MKRLHRSRRIKLLGGVAAGFAEYFSVDVTLMRLGFALVAILIPNAILAYILAWIIIPEEPLGEANSPRENPTPRASDNRMDEKKEAGVQPPTAEEILGNRPDVTAPQPAARPATPVKSAAPAKRDAHRENRRQLFGYFLVFLGATFLVRRFIPDFVWRIPSSLVGHFWPVLIILLGVALIFGTIRGR